MADAKISALTSATLPLAGTEVVPVVQGGTTKKVSIFDIGHDIRSALAADQSNLTTTPSKVTGLDEATGVGTFIFEYWIRYQSLLSTTGVKFDVNHSGTVSSFVWQQRWVDVGTAASGTAPTQNVVVGNVMSSFASRSKGTAGRGVTASSDAAASDMLMIIEGLMIVTVAGNLELWHGSEVAAQSTVKAGSSVRISRTA